MMIFGSWYHVERKVRQMKMNRISAILVSALLLAAASDVTASDFSCGSKIVTAGNYKYDVLGKCGEPSNAEVWEEVRIKRDPGSRLLEAGIELQRVPLLVEEVVTVEEWEYNLGSNRFIRYLRFENGRLVRITEGDYGY